MDRIRMILACVKSSVDERSSVGEWRFDEINGKRKLDARSIKC